MPATDSMIAKRLLIITLIGMLIALGTVQHAAFGMPGADQPEAGQHLEMAEGMTGVGDMSCSPGDTGDGSCPICATCQLASVNDTHLYAATASYAHLHMRTMMQRRFLEKEPYPPRTPLG